MLRYFARVVLFMEAGLAAPMAASGQVAVSPAAPRMLDPVRLQVTSSGTFVYDLDKTKMSMSGNTIDVILQFGGALSPPPPARTDELLLGELPMGTYTVNVRRNDGTALTTIGSVTFTVEPRSVGDASPANNYSDLWWNAEQSGWGLNIVQHASGNLFVTWFAYGSDGRPTWYVVPGGRWVLDRVFQGPVYRTRGPVVADSFDPSAVQRTLAGTATLQFSSTSPDAGAMTMQLEGLTFGSPITRQPY